MNYQNGGKKQRRSKLGLESPGDYKNMGLSAHINFPDWRATLVSRFRRAAQKLWRNTCDYGSLHAAGKVAVALAHPVYYSRTYMLYRANLAGMRVPPNNAPPFTIRLLLQGEDDLLAQIKKMEEWLEGRIEPILLGGGKCLVALDQGKLLGFNLISFKNIHLPVVRFMRPLRSGEAFSEQVTVNRQYRGRGVGEHLRRAAFGLLQAEGIQRFYGGTDARNCGNLALSRKVGLEVIAEIHYVKFLTMERKWIRRIPK